MAYVQDSLVDEEDEQSGGANIPGSGGGNGALQSAAPSSPSSTGPTAQKTPGRFADLSEYLRVNQPQEFGSQLAGKVGGQIQKGEQTLNNAQDQFKQRVDTNTVKDSQGLINQVGTAPESIDANAYAGLRDATYKGPQTLSDARDLSSQVEGAAKNAVGQAGASKTEGGRFALLDNYYGRPTYSQGQKSLDNLLVQNDKNSQQAFDQMQKNATTLQSNVKQAGVNLGNYAGAAKAATQDTRNAARSAVGIDDNGNRTGTGALGQANDAINSQLASRNASKDSDYAALTQAFQSGDYSKLSPELKSALNFGDLTSTYGVNPSQYLSSVNNLTAQQTATPEQAARIKALNKLGGVEDSAWDDPGVSSYDNEGLFNFDTNTLKNQVGTQKAAYEGALTSTPAPITGRPGTSDTVDVNNLLANVFPSRYKANNSPDAGFTNGKPGPGANKPITLPSLGQAKQDIESALRNPSSWQDGNTSQVYIDRVTAALQNALSQLNAQATTVGDQYGANSNLKWS